MLTNFTKSKYEIGKVYQTYDYDLFESHAGNRKINETHVNKLIASFQKERILSHITVYEENGKLIVWDGQHRLAALMRLQWIIYFLVVEKPEAVSPATMNNAQSKWIIDDYIHSNITLGNYNYILFAKAYEHINNIAPVGSKRTLHLAHLIDIARHVKSRNGEHISRRALTTSVREGHFTFNEKEADEVIELCVDMCQIFFLSYHKGGMDKQFIYAFLLFSSLKNFTLQNFIEKIETTNKMQQYRKVEDYLENFEHVYNFKKSSKKIKYHFDPIKRKSEINSGKDTWKSGLQDLNE